MELSIVVKKVLLKHHVLNFSALKKVTVPVWSVQYIISNVILV